MTHATLTILLNLLNFQKPAPLPAICYVYKIQYNNATDSSRFLIEIQYFNKEMDIIREINVGPKGQKDDTCDIQLNYDLHGNKTRELTICSPADTTGQITRQFKYGKSGGVVEEKSIQEKPYFACYVTAYKHDSVTKAYYSERMHFINGKADQTDIDVMGFKGNVTLSYSINDEGDTGNVHIFIYRPIADTDKVSMGMDQNRGLGNQGAEKQILYYNNSGKVELISFFQNDTFTERRIIKYNVKSKLLSERYFSVSKNKYVLQTTNLYDRGGELMEKKEENLEDGLTKKYEYEQERLIREDYIYNGQLDHAIIYSYKTK